MADHDHDNCGTCGRAKGCPECGRTPWPGYLAADGGWRDGYPPSNGGHVDQGLALAIQSHEEALTRYEMARVAWENAISARTAKELELRSRPEAWTSSGPIERSTPAEAREVERLLDVERQAEEAMRRAGKAVVEARQAEARVRQYAHQT